MNKKGFAISTMLYGLIFVTLAVFYLILSIVSYRYQANINHVGSLRSELQNVRDEVVESSEIATPFKLGDYFNLTPDVATYTVSSSVTGYDSDQTINIAGTDNTNGLRLWRVIDIHKDGSVDAVSEYVSYDAVYFKGTTGYQYFVSTLELIAEQYAKSGYTIGTRMMGYNGQTKVIPTKSSNCTGTCQTTTTYAFDGSTNAAPTTTTTQYSTTVGQEYLGGVGGDTLHLKDYELVRNVYKSDTTTYGSTGLIAYDVSDSTTAKAYWIVSRKFVWANDTNFSFNGRYIDTSGEMYISSNFRWFYTIFSSSIWHDYYSSHSVRPIITLKSGITINGGSGTKTNPYTLS